MKDMKDETLCLHAGYDPKNGARPLRRAIEDNLESIVSDAIILGNLKKTRAAGRTDSDDVYDAWGELMKKFLTRMADKENLQIISPLDEIDDLEIDIANGA